MIKSGTTWYNRKSSWYKDTNGLWVSPSEEWVKVDGTWKQLIPPQIIVPSVSSDHGGIYASTQIGRYVATAYYNEVGQAIDGSASHNGYSHGSKAAFTSGASALSTVNGLNTLFTPKRNYNTSKSHTHSISAHTHAFTTAYHDPLTRDYVPYQYCDAFEPNSVILSISSKDFDVLYPDDFSLHDKTSNRFMRFNPTYQNVASLIVSHNHQTQGSTGGTTGDADTGAFDAYCYSGSQSFRYPTVHKHSMGHNHGDTTITPLHLAIHGVRPKRVMYFNELPVGALVLSTVKVAPASGWGLFPNGTNLTRYLLKFGSAGGGSLTHSVGPTTTMSTGGIYNTYLDKIYNVQSDVEYGTASHTHTMNHTHSNVYHMPLLRGFFVYQKTS